MSVLVSLPQGDDLDAMLASGEYVDSDNYTGGGDLVDQQELEGVPFLIIGYDLRKSSKFATVVNGIVTPAEYLTIHCVMSGPRTVLFNDSGVGIRPVVEEHFEKFPDKPLYCKRGLRISEYQKELDTGEVITATTAYIG
jgi:hypothetical protein